MVSVVADGFDKRLKEARERAGLTQDELAHRLDRHKFTISKWEQGLHPPKKPSDFDEIAYQVGCSVVWLRDGAGEVGRVYIPDPEMPDAVRRRGHVRRTLRAVHARDSHDPATAYSVEGVDWTLVSRCAVHLLRVQPDLEARVLARALPICYAMALRTPDICDDAMAAQILQAMG